ncbi:acyltransferase family protein [Massilia sp. TSP1-1-2]|uniref:acyltransferase family protein n=1 Tax=unclassified Massilia TaxID=2609279 RepID=UPI003CEB45AE
MNPNSRLYFLDWVRILAFLVLILYHVGMYYVTWDWHVKSAFASDVAEPFMMLSSPWRLGLLFLISGVAASFMLAKVGAARFMRQRSVRLLVPLVFGMFVIVPPQAYFELVEKVAYNASYSQFMHLYMTTNGDFCRSTECLRLPTWNHLWFVAYLWVYTLVLGAIVLALGPRFDAVARKVVAALAGWKLIVLPVAVLGMARIALLSRFPATHDLTGDWYNHATYLPLFILGAMLGRSGAAWQRFDDARWIALGLACASWAALIVFYSLPDNPALHAAIETWRMAMRVVYMLCAWSAIMAACGFAQRHLNRDNASRVYLTEAVFPVYILHQTLIVSIAHLIKPAKVAPGPEALILIVLTITISFGVFELVRRVGWLRPFFGLGRPVAAPELVAVGAKGWQRQFS